MDDASPKSLAKATLDEAVASMDQNNGFATLNYNGREIILMTEEKFEEWEDAVDIAAIERAIANPDPDPISLDDLRKKYNISPPAA